MTGNKLKKILKAVENTKLYSAKEVTEALKESGFKVEKSKGFDDEWIRGGRNLW